MHGRCQVIKAGIAVDVCRADDVIPRATVHVKRVVEAGFSLGPDRRKAPQVYA
jgi:hypothetical protein